MLDHYIVGRIAPLLGSYLLLSICKVLQLLTEKPASYNLVIRNANDCCVQVCSKILISENSLLEHQTMVMSTGSLVYAVSLAAMIIFNIAGNSLVCIIILKKKAMKTSINWLLFHLAIADLLVAVFYTPPCILSHFIELPSGIIGDLLCKFIMGGALGWASASASSFLLVLIAFERYYATVQPLKTLSRGRSLRLVPILWILAVLLVTPKMAVFTYREESQMCMVIFADYATARAYYVIWSCSDELLPICIMGYLYARIILCLRNRSLVPVSFQKNMSQSRNKVTTMLISVSAIFVICWTPPAVLCLLSPVIPGQRVTAYKVSTACALLNSCLNPLVYTLHSQQFRKNVAALVSCCKRK